MGAPPQERALPLLVGWSRSTHSASGEEKQADEPALAAPRPVPDEELMDRLNGNDAVALDLLFRRYSRLIFGIALRIVHDRGEAEDVVQEVFLNLYQKPALFDPAKRTAKGWIVNIAFHRACDKRTRLNRKGFYRGTEIESLDDTLVGDTDLDREIGSKLNREQLERAFEELSELQRRTLDLFYFEGLDLRDISEKLGVPLPNVRHHYYRGLANLRKSAFVKRLREK